VVVGAYLVVRAIVGFGHELTVAALAWLLHLVVATGVWEPAIRQLGLDPIYAGAAIRAAGGVQVAGFALACPIGSPLHSLFPAVFLACDQVARGAAVSMVAVPGAPAIGRGLATFGADVIWLTLGLWLFWHWRRLNWRVAMLGLLIQAQIAVNHLLEAQIGLADLDASGLPFAIQVAVPNGGWFTSNLASLPSDVRAAIFGLALLVVGYLSAASLILVGGVARRWLNVKRPGRFGLTGPMRPSAVAVGVVVAFATACSPIGGRAVGASNWHMATGVRFAMRSIPRVHANTSSEVIRGVGYNPQYAGLSPTDRAAVYDRDFSEMQRLGINTIEGWFENQFDGVTLDAAQRHGIGVLMPFELNQDWDYTDPSVRAGILERVSAYVEEYKDHPAVRMWAPGNENLHRVLYAHWVSQANVPAARARAEAFATFLPELVDRIHALDPNHPVVYRDAEDVYLPWIKNGFAQAGGDERPWLIYGANVYSAGRLQDIISAWPTEWPGHALLISEYAPGGVGPAERPLGFQQQWQVIRSRPDVVLGGLAYTWATNGPEDLDRVFGLVDANGVPTDGALAALSGAYLADT
jgi:hypothetical protein